MEKLVAIILSLLFLLILLISAAELLLYGFPGWFEHEYSKYDVLEDLNRELSMEQALYVTDEWMSYLRGGREDLQVLVTAERQEQELFTDREKAHMADVKGLFMGGLRLRNICLIALLFITILYVRRFGKAPLARTFTHTTITCFVLVALVGIMAAMDFTKAFTIFHQVFFDNDLWILSPRKDDMINLLPEEFFVDTALAIARIFIALSVMALLIARVIIRKEAEKFKPMKSA